jgi:hypothetical protein
LPIMRSAFKNINEAGIITNKGLEAWD